MMSFLKRLFAVCLALMLFVFSSFSAFAQALDYNRSCSLTLNCPKELYATTVLLYKAASIGSDGSLTVDDSLAGAKADLSQTDAKSMESAALSLWVYANAAQNGVSALSTRTVDENGTVSFGGLAVGVYLVYIRQLVNQGTVYTTAPFLISVPQTDEITGELVYDVDSSPKAETTEQGETVTVEVRKLWDDAAGKNQRPAEITVSLFENGVLYDTQILSAQSAWSYKWTGLSSSAEWSVAESNVPYGYTVKYAKSGNAFIITNTYDKPETTTQPHPDNGEKLPVTGMLQWPIPVLAMSGLLLFAAGWWIVNNDRRKR